MVDRGHFRYVLGHLPTGVTVVTAMTAGGPVGLAANSVTSVSLNPPLILLCPSCTSETWPPIRSTGSFCVNVMAGHHAEIARQFSRKGIDRFAGVAWQSRSNGAPGLTDAIAWIDCEIDHEYAAGDHTIVVSAVSALDVGEFAEPLVFFRRDYGGFATREA
jgi:3-hydroxy-9,10-secoandrosta-1,3,5(10)-triene-9,17-dione monooxygenase reductase component